MYLSKGFRSSLDESKSIEWYKYLHILQNKMIISRLREMHSYRIGLIQTDYPENLIVISVRCLQQIRLFITNISNLLN